MVEFLYYGITLFMTVIMLNLLIAIIGNSYDKIKDCEEEVYCLNN